MLSTTAACPGGGLSVACRRAPLPPSVSGRRSSSSGGLSSSPSISSASSPHTSSSASSGHAFACGRGGVHCSAHPSPAALGEEGGQTSFERGFSHGGGRGAKWQQVRAAIRTAPGRRVACTLVYTAGPPHLSPSFRVVCDLGVLGEYLIDGRASQPTLFFCLFLPLFSPSLPSTPHSRRACGWLFTSAAFLA